MAESPQASPRGLTIQIDSRQDWEGLSSEKFRYHQKKHYSPREGSTNTLYVDSVIQPQSAKRHFPTTYGVPEQERCRVKQFPELKHGESTPFLPPIRTKQEFIPSPRAYGPTQKRHLYQDGSDEYVYHPSKRVFQNIFKKAPEIDVEKLMGKKKIMGSFQDHRNLVGIASLGDKPYKYPEYASGFYHARGLIAGSTITYKQTGKTTGNSPEPAYLYDSSPRGVSWREKTKIEQRSEDVRAVKGLNEWEPKSVFKEVKRGRANNGGARKKGN